MNTKQRDQLLAVISYAKCQIVDYDIDVLGGSNYESDEDAEDQWVLQAATCDNLEELVKSLPVEAPDDSERTMLIKYCQRCDPNGWFTDDYEILAGGKPLSLKEAREWAKLLDFYM